MGYPNAAERRRLERFPDRIAVEDLRACFALSDRDRLLVFDQRGPENRLGLAVSLSALRFLGFVPDEITSIPDEALVFVAGQVDAAAHELLGYGARAQTRPSGSNGTGTHAKGAATRFVVRARWVGAVDGVLVGRLGDSVRSYSVRQAGFHGDLESRMLSWRKGILRSHGSPEEVPR